MADDRERHSLLFYLEARFGIPVKHFENYLLFRRKKSWTLVRNTPQIVGAGRLKVSKVGIKAFQKVGAFVKPTTRMIQVFGHAATRAVCEIDEKQLQTLLAGEALIKALDLDKGYVILRLENDFILGLGFYANGKVRSQLPRKDLRTAMFQRG